MVYAIKVTVWTGYKVKKKIYFKFILPANIYYLKMCEWMNERMYLFAVLEIQVWTTIENKYV